MRKGTFRYKMENVCIVEEKLRFDFSAANSLCLKAGGDWRISAGLPSLTEITAQLSSHPEITEVTFQLSQDILWDSAFISLLLALYKDCQRRNIRFSIQTLPEGIQKMLNLALKVRERIMPVKIAQEAFLEKAGRRALELKENVFLFFGFLGDLTAAFFRLITGRAYFRSDEFFLIVQRCGAGALGLVSLISVLVGVILAFIGAIQLKMFGAQIFIADIVGISMVRVMGAVMTGVLLAGRTGASFAAELGIMQINEEIDALKTLGLNPAELLVMPRVIALVIMTPLLNLYAGFMGIVGGFAVSTGMLGLNPVEYINHTQAAVRLNHIWIGLVHSFVFGIIIAISGCLRGMNCKRSAEGLGLATTSAVVAAITYMVAATAVITYICQLLGV
jgi:phospholipid/cholesterol/gamma-HCH transport system permease protein